MRGLPEFNFPEFRRVTKILRAAGYTIFSPAEMDEERGFDGTTDVPYDFDLSAAIMRDLDAIVQADGIIMLPGWEKSSGVRVEKAMTEFLGKDVLEYLEAPMPFGGTPIWTLRPYDHPDTLAAIEETHSSEIRVTNEQTGGQKGRKLERFELLPWDQLAKVARLYHFGASKYADHNWRKGYSWSLSFGAMMRHASLFWQGESLDSETGEHHLTSVVFHALALMWFEERYAELDDRYVTIEGVNDATGTA